MSCYIGYLQRLVEVAFHEMYRVVHCVAADFVFADLSDNVRKQKRAYELPTGKCLRIPALRR